MKNFLFYFSIFVLSVFVAKSAFSSQQESSVYLGVYENLHDAWDKNRPAQVRVAFQSTDAGWVAMKHNPRNVMELNMYAMDFPKSVSWTVIYDGKKLGNLFTTFTVPRYYSEIGIQTIVSKLDFREILVGASGFIYWVGRAKARPLLMSSGKYFEDPEVWKPTKLTEQEKEIVISEFKKYVPMVLDCKGSKNVVRNYGESEIRFEVPFCSKKGTLLIGLGLNKDKYHCDCPTGHKCGERWFVIFKNGRIKHLGLGIHPIDAADLKNEGKSEWLFQRGKYNKDGYTIFYDNFSKSETFDWNYH